MIGFEESKNSVIMKEIILFGLFGLAVNAFGQTTCVDPLACNFTELGECEFLDDNGMPCVTEGCAIPGACNFNPEADINDGSCEFTSCLGCTDEAACNYDPEAVYLDLSCIYFVDCNGVCGGDWIEDECGNCYPEQAEEIVVDFEALALWDSNQGLQSLFGDVIVQVDSFYFSGIVEEVVPPTGAQFALVEAKGARGGGWLSNCFEGNNDGGSGAYVSALIGVTTDSLFVVVGGGGDDGVCRAGGGGGASALYTFEGVPLVVAGGGGGVGDDCTQDGYFSSFASLGELGNAGAYCSDVGPVGGSGVECCDYPAGTGAGFYAGSLVSDENGQSILSGAMGGTGEINGGFGGGGAACCSCNSNQGFGGGGGGYSGGGLQCNDDAAGGGGSFAEGVWAEFEHHQETNGSMVITWIFGPSQQPECQLGCVVPQACNFDSEATNDDGSCDFCFCGPGTEYDIELGQCMIVNGSPDINGDGCTNLNDLLDLLSGYGTCED